MAVSFECSLPRDIVFGAGVRTKLGALTAKFGRRVLLITGANSLKAGGHLESVLKDFREHGIASEIATADSEPTVAIVDAIVSAFKNKNIDCVVAVGGGTVVDTGKAVAAMLTVGGTVKRFLEKVGTESHAGTTLPCIAVPTTAGTGSEATKNAVISQPGPGGFKSSLRHNTFVPVLALIDPELHLSCPPDITASCGMDTFTQLLESYVSTGATPFTDAVAWSGLERAAYALVPSAGEQAANVSMRADMAYAALMSGITLAHAGLGAVHGIAPALGSHCPIRHGEACGTLLAVTTSATITKLYSVYGDSSPAIRKYARVGRLVSGLENASDSRACDALVETLYRWTEVLQMRPLGAFGIRPADSGPLAEKCANKNNPIELSTSEFAVIIAARV